MKLTELIHNAAAAYPDAQLLAYWDGQRAVHNPAGGDTLAEFIVKELCDTFDADATEAEQRAEATRVLRRAVSELQSVIAALLPVAASPADQMIANAMALHHQLFVVEDCDSSALMEYDTLLADLEQMGYRSVTTLAFEREEEDKPDEEAAHAT
ncbi:MAG: hypothetical protein NTY53_14050 [Kiritimatiellaeota bacterium]|nr:hypothetical protein [Kiritimatiellota bacterium]